MATPFNPAADTRRGGPSPRPKGRDSKNTIPCKNIAIYGHCRYEHNGCMFNHETTKVPPAMASISNENIKQRLNVDSPSFTPLGSTANGTSGSKSATISPKAASAAPFTPKTQKRQPAGPSVHAKEFAPSNSGVSSPAPEFVPQAQGYTDFTPHGYDTQQSDQDAAAMLAAGAYPDPFTTSNTMSSLGAAIGNSNNQMPMNPYSQDASNVPSNSFFQNAHGFTQPLQYHLYSSMAPHRTDLKEYQKVAHDFFIPDHLREDLQKKSEATRQVLPNSTLPNVEYFHTLVPLDINSRRDTQIFGYTSILYKAESFKNGRTYALRRLENFRLTNETPIRNCQKTWKNIDCSAVVTIHDCFTTRAFGDSSLIFVTDYHPLSKTLAEHHAKPPAHNSRHGYGQREQPKEDVLWSYLVQLAMALRTIHGANLAVRTMHPSKVILTSKGRIRLSACGIQDVSRFDDQRPVVDFQQEDFMQLGQLIIHVSNTNSHPQAPLNKVLENLGRMYKSRLVDAVRWLIQPWYPEPATPTSPSHSAEVEVTQQPEMKSIDTFLQFIFPEMTTVLDNQMKATDTITSSLALELENSRMFRLLSKLGFINERPEHDMPHHPSHHGQSSNPHALPHSQGGPQGPSSNHAVSSAGSNSNPNPNTNTANPNSWSETGQRYYLKLFRDYLFHSVDEAGRPVVDLAHVISALNKLDTGSDEKILLMSREENNVFVVSYRELKRGVEMAFRELVTLSQGQGHLHGQGHHSHGHGHGGHGQGAGTPLGHGMGGRGMGGGAGAGGYGVAGAGGYMGLGGRR